MSEPLEPMAPGLKALLQQGADVRPPDGTAARVLSQLMVATAHGPTPAAALPRSAAGLRWGAKWLASGLIVGAAGGLVAGRTWFERVEVRLVERPMPAVAPAPAVAPLPPPRVEAPVVEPVTVAPNRKEPRKAAAPTDASLAQERSLLETARSALARGEAARALESLNEHQRRFADGRLSEERESLAVQSLLRLGQAEAARARAAKFHQRWPDSLFGPVVDDAFP